MHNPDPYRTAERRAVPQQPSTMPPVIPAKSGTRVLVCPTCAPDDGYAKVSTRMNPRSGSPLENPRWVARPAWIALSPMLDVVLYDGLSRSDVEPHNALCYHIFNEKWQLSFQVR